MIKAVAINGSPRKAAGNTALVLNPFLDGLREAGAEVTLYYASKLDINPCSCGRMLCWYDTPGKCCFRDDMDLLLPELKGAEILVFATPVYIPLPGAMQNVLNRLCPLVEPRLEYRQSRTRARFREDVSIRKMALVSTGGWWESENMAIPLRIVEELAENSGAEFSGAVLRPHAFCLEKDGELTDEGREILDLVKQAGIQLIQEGKMDPATLSGISRPLLPEADLLGMYNQWLS